MWYLLWISRGHWLTEISPGNCTTRDNRRNFNSFRESEDNCAKCGVWRFDLKLLEEICWPWHYATTQPSHRKVAQIHAFNLISNTINNRAPQVTTAICYVVEWRHRLHHLFSIFGNRTTITLWALLLVWALCQLFVDRNEMFLRLSKPSQLLHMSSRLQNGLEHLINVGTEIGQFRLLNGLLPRLLDWCFVEFWKVSLKTNEKTSSCDIYSTFQVTIH